MVIGVVTSLVKKKLVIRSFRRIEQPENCSSFNATKLIWKFRSKRHSECGGASVVERAQ